MQVASLPDGFVFPIRRRMLRDALKPFGSSIDEVEMSGISHSEPKKGAGEERATTWFWAGSVTARPSDLGWRFRVAINGVRSERTATLGEQVEAILAADATRFFAHTLALQTTDPAASKAHSLHLGFDLADGAVRSRSFVSSKD